MESEIWRPVVGYEGLYEVSSIGRIRSVDRLIECKNGVIHHIKGRIIRPCVSQTGYLCVSLSKNNTGKTLKLHRIVATAFIENKYNKPHVDHIDTDRKNCKVSNLRWATRKENANNPNSILNCSRAASKKYGSGWKMIETRNRNQSRGAEIPICQYSTQRVFIKRFRSIAEAARETGVQDASIHLYLRGKLRHAGGYLWAKDGELPKPYISKRGVWLKIKNNNV